MLSQCGPSHVLGPVSLGHIVNRVPVPAVCHYFLEVSSRLKMILWNVSNQKCSANVAPVTFSGQTVWVT
jgi:hypothetical protein